MALSVMLLDMLELRRLPESGHIPIQFPNPLMQVGIPRPDISDVTLEVLDIHGVETDDGRVESDICFGDGGAEVVRVSVFSEVGFGAVEATEERGDGFLVGVLSGCETGFVDAVVDVVVGPVVCAFYLGL